MHLKLCYALYLDANPILIMWHLFSKIGFAKTCSQSTVGRAKPYRAALRRLRLCPLQQRVQSTTKSGMPFWLEPGGRTQTNNSLIHAIIVLP